MSKPIFNDTSKSDHLLGENLLAFDILEFKACCSKHEATDNEGTIWDIELESYQPNAARNTRRPIKH